MSNMTRLSSPAPQIKRPEYSIPSDNLIAAGKRLRDSVSRASHAGWKPQNDRADPIDILRASDEGREVHIEDDR